MTAAPPHPLPLPHSHSHSLLSDPSPSRPLYRTTPPSSNHESSPTPLAERRKTQVSNYLVSQDFKSDFASKLNHLRQRERASTKPTHPEKHPPDFVSPSKSTPPHASGDQDSLKEEGEETEAGWTSSWRKEAGRSSGSSMIRGSETEGEEQGARYEVIRKLADRLAEQMEQNDHLVYELGVVRASNARLKAVEMDQSDELTCLKQRVRNLEALVATRNLAAIHHHAHTRLAALKSHLHLVRSKLAHLQLQLHPSENPSSAQSVRHSWPCRRPPASSSPTKPEPSPTEETKHFDLLGKIHQLEVELFQCHEARITSGVTLQALLDWMDKESLEEEVELPDLSAKKGGPVTSPMMMGLASFTFSGWGGRKITPDPAASRLPARCVSVSGSISGSISGHPPSSALLSLDDQPKSFGFRSLFSYANTDPPLAKSLLASPTTPPATTTAPTSHCSSASSVP